VRLELNIICKSLMVPNGPADWPYAECTNAQAFGVIFLGVLWMRTVQPVLIIPVLPGFITLL